MASREVALYVGSALTEAPVEFVELIVEEFKRRMEKRGYKILHFLGVTNGTASDVVDKDLGNTADCTHLITFVDYPSTGLGMELYKAITMEKPILCLYRQGRRVTRMVTGHAEKGKLVMESYQTVDEALGKAITFVNQHPATVLKAAE